MLVEVGVLGGEQGVDDELRDLVEAHRLAVALAELAEQDAVGGVHLGKAADGGELQVELIRIAQPALLEVFDRAKRSVGFEKREQPEQRCS